MIDADLERQYNTRAAVPDSAAIIAGWARESERVRANHPHARDLRYGPGQHELLDLFPAPASQGLLLFLHGGYWRAFYKEHFSYIAPPFLARGVSVAVASYDLCPQVTLAGLTEQCRRAAAWLAHHASAHGAPGPLVVAGHSAGGHLAGMLFATRWAEYGLAGNPITGAVSVSGLFDLTPLVRTSVNESTHLTPAEARALSPVNHVPTTSAPFVLAVGSLESEGFHRQSQLLRHAWPENCREVISLEGRHHFDAPDLLPELALPLFSNRST